MLKNMLQNMQTMNARMVSKTSHSTTDGQVNKQLHSLLDFQKQLSTCRQGNFFECRNFFVTIDQSFYTSFG